VFLFQLGSLAVAEAHGHGAHKARGGLEEDEGGEGGKGVVSGAGNAEVIRAQAAELAELRQRLKAAEMLVVLQQPKPAHLAQIEEVRAPSPTPAGDGPRSRAATAQVGRDEALLAQARSLISEQQAQIDALREKLQAAEALPRGAVVVVENGAGGVEEEGEGEGEGDGSSGRVAALQAEVVMLRERVARSETSTPSQGPSAEDEERERAVVRREEVLELQRMLAAAEARIAAMAEARQARLREEVEGVEGERVEAAQRMTELEAEVAYLADQLAAARSALATPTPCAQQEEGEEQGGGRVGELEKELAELRRVLAEASARDVLGEGQGQGGPSGHTEAKGSNGDVDFYKRQNLQLEASLEAAEKRIADLAAAVRARDEHMTASSYKARPTDCPLKAQSVKGVRPRPDGQWEEVSQGGEGALSSSFGSRARQDSFSSALSDFSASNAPAATTNMFLDAVSGTPSPMPVSDPASVLRFAERCSSSCVWLLCMCADGVGFSGRGE
jgi:hypothetical protein